MNNLLIFDTAGDVEQNTRQLRISRQISDKQSLLSNDTFLVQKVAFGRYYC